MAQDSQPEPQRARPGAAVRDAVAPYQRPDTGRAAWQLLNSVGGYLLCWVAMFFTVKVSWWLTVPIAVVAAGLLVRVFIIMHDCGHGSFLPSRRANDAVGAVCGALAFTPYRRWRWEHARHHAASGNLDKRGTGDIWTLTVEEYRRASRWRRLGYRLVRQPVWLFTVGPFYQSLFKERLPGAAEPARERRSVWWTNAALLLMALGLGWALGWKEYLVIQAIIIGVSGAAGIWLFYIQHQFEEAYWARGDSWDFARAALEGSSYYRLPRLLQWFSGNIGFHHIHHLSPRVPNYRLQQCHESNATLSAAPAITLRGSLKSLRLRLWDEASGKMVGFASLR